MPSLAHLELAGVQPVRLLALEARDVRLERRRHVRCGLGVERLAPVFVFR